MGVQEVVGRAVEMVSDVAAWPPFAAESVAADAAAGFAVEAAVYVREQLGNVGAAAGLGVAVAVAAEIGFAVAAVAAAASSDY